jgi:hypothetical protein
VRQREGGCENRGDHRNRNRHAAIGEDKLLATRATRDRRDERDGQRFEVRGLRNLNPEHHTLAPASHDAPAHLARPAFPARRASLASRASRPTVRGAGAVYHANPAMWISLRSL